MKEIIGALSEALNIAESELSSALLDGEKVKAEAGTFLKSKFSEHITKINTEAEEKRKKDVEQAQGRGARESAEKFEKALYDTLGIDKTLKGNDLLSKLPEVIATLKKGDESPEKIKASETYIKGLKETEERLKQEYESKIGEKEQALTALQQSVQTEKVNTSLLSKAREFVDKLQFRTDIPQEAIQALKATAEQKLLSGKFKMMENGELVPVDEKGEVLKNNLGHIVKIEELITEAYKPLDALKITSKERSDGGGGAGGGEGGKGGSSLESFGIAKPQTVDAYKAVVKQIADKQNKGEINLEVAQKLSEEAQAAVIEANKA